MKRKWNKKMLKRILLVTTVVCLVGCGNSYAEENGKEANEVSDTSFSAVNATVESTTNSEIQAAIDASRMLYACKGSDRFFLLGDGICCYYLETLTDDFEKREENIERAVFYCELDDIVKLCYSGKDVLALTSEGKLYNGEELLMENIYDIAFVTNTYAWEGGWEGRYITNDGEYGTVLTSYPSGELIISEDTEKFGQTATIISEHSNFALLFEDGSFQMDYEYEDEEEYINCDTSGWDNIAVLAFGVSTGSDFQDGTIAAITKDGKTLATGAYADEILSWGDLIYIDMCEGIIAGLTTEGTIKVTGYYGELLKSEADVESWTDITGLSVPASDILNVASSDGTIYYIYTYSQYIYTQYVCSKSEGELLRTNHWGWWVNDDGTAYGYETEYTSAYATYLFLKEE